MSQEVPSPWGLKQWVLQEIPHLEILLNRTLKLFSLHVIAVQFVLTESLIAISPVTWIYQHLWNHHKDSRWDTAVLSVWMLSSWTNQIVVKEDPKGPECTPLHVLSTHTSHHSPLFPWHIVLLFETVWRAQFTLEEQQKCLKLTLNWSNIRSLNCLNFLFVSCLRVWTSEPGNTVVEVSCICRFCLCYHVRSDISELLRYMKMFRL